MPATSEKQKRFMDAAAHNPAFAKAAGVPQTVAKDFSEKSKGLKFGKGSDSRADLQKVNKPEALHGKSALFKKGGETMAKADVKKLFKGKETYAEEFKEAKAVAAKKVTPKQFAKAEKAEGYKDEEKGAFGTGKKIAAGKLSPAKYAKMEATEPKKMARGGGVEIKGKTKGGNITMKRGGKC